jgi:hypothetical protein
VGYITETYSARHTDTINIFQIFILLYFSIHRVYSKEMWLRKKKKKKEYTEMHDTWHLLDHHPNKNH